jgi:hypothetical protein
VAPFRADPIPMRLSLGFGSFSKLRIASGHHAVKRVVADDSAIQKEASMF